MCSAGCGQWMELVPPIIQSQSEAKKNIFRLKFVHQLNNLVYPYRTDLDALSRAYSIISS